MIGEWLTRVRFLFAWKRRGEMDEELRFHLEQSIALKVAEGMSPAEARRVAMVEFGGVEATREECERQRPGWWMAGVLRDVRYAARGILAHRWFSAAIVVTLALGIGLNTMVFTLVNVVLFKPVPVPGGAQLVSVMNYNHARSDQSVPMSLPDFEQYRAQSTVFDFLEGATRESGVLVEKSNAPQRYSMTRATAGIFAMVQAKAVLGRGFLPSDVEPGAAPVMVIGYGVWKDRYSSSAGVIGRQVNVNGQPATIVGVMPEGFRFPENSDLWMPLVPTPELAKRDNRALWGYGMLKRGATLRAADAELNGIAGRLAAQFPEDKDLYANVLTFHQRFNGGKIRVVFLLMLAAVGFVLLIACADVANMMLSRSLSREREMSIRAALGAGRWRIVRQLLIESVVLSTMGGVLGLGLAASGVHWFDLQTKQIRPYWIEFSTDFTVFGYFAALCILSGVLFGIAPALRSSRPDLMGVLNDGARGSGRRSGGWLSATLVVFQFAVTLVLLTGAGIFVRSLMNSLSTNAFIPAAKLTTARVDLPEKRYKDADARVKYFDELLPELRAIPGVEHAAIASDAPGLGAGSQPVELEHVVVANLAQRPRAAILAVSPGYFETIHMPILSGRGFGEMDGAAHREAAVVTRDGANMLWPGQDAVGKRLRLLDDDGKPGEWITVVGISGNMLQEAQEDVPKPLMFLPYRQQGWGNMTLIVESDVDPLASMRKAAAKIDAELPLSEPRRLDAAIQQQVWFLSLFGKIFTGFALIAMLMAAVGLYSVIAHATSSRTQEIGVRIALGATVGNILLLMMRRGLWQIGAGLAIGVAGVVPMARVAGTVGVSGQVTEIFLVAALLLAMVGVFACWLPARRAALLDPVKAIRCE